MGTDLGQESSIRQHTWLSSPAALALGSLLATSLLGCFLFGVAGQLNLPWFWFTLVVFGICHLFMVLVVFRLDPGLARERWKPGSGTPMWDKVILSLSGVLILTNLIAAPLDVGRLHWTDSVPASLQFAGLLGVVGGMAFLSWAMFVNTYFSKVVRIQRDRGHVVISTGPYRFVRHPGYLGWIVLWISMNVALGSWMAVAMSFLMVVVIVVRTWREDLFLRQNLGGYVDYATRVKWRLVPGIW